MPTAGTPHTHAKNNLHPSTGRRKTDLYSPTSRKKTDWHPQRIVQLNFYSFGFSYQRGTYFHAYFCWVKYCFWLMFLFKLWFKLDKNWNWVLQLPIIGSIVCQIYTAHINPNFAAKFSKILFEISVARQVPPIASLASLNWSQDNLSDHLLQQQLAWLAKGWSELWFSAARGKHCECCKLIILFLKLTLVF